MPEISRFLGIIIRMFAEPATQHRRPHFHAYYQQAAAMFAFDTMKRGRRFTEPNCRATGSGIELDGPLSRLNRFTSVVFEQ